MEDDFVYDAKAVAIVNAVERAICRLNLHTQDEFVSLLNAIEVQVEDGIPDLTALDHLCAALLALADARGADRRKLKLDARVASLLQHVARRIGAAR